MPISRQTPAGNFFSYNPFTGANVLLFPIDRPADMPRVFILHTSPAQHGYATACNGRVELFISDTRQITCHVNGRETQRFSVKFAPTKQRRKKAFAAY